MNCLGERERSSEKDDVCDAPVAAGDVGPVPAWRDAYESWPNGRSKCVARMRNTRIRASSLSDSIASATLLNASRSLRRSSAVRGACDSSDIVSPQKELIVRDPSHYS